MKVAGAGLLLLAGVLAGCTQPGAPERAEQAGQRLAPVAGPTKADRVVPVELRERARITLPPGDGDDIVAVGGSIWVKLQDGHLVRVDPSTNKVAASIALDAPGLPADRHCQGLGTDGTSVWTCATRAKTTPIVRIDPATGKVVETFDVDKASDQVTLPYALGRIWVLTGDGSTLVGLKPGGDMVTLPLEMACSQVTGRGPDLLLTCPLRDTVLRVDATTGKTLARAQVRRPVLISATSRDAWVAGTEGLLRMDAKTLEPTTLYAILNAQNAGAVVATDDEVWVRVAGTFLYRIDPRSGSLTEHVTADPRLSGGSVLVTDDSVWTTAFGNRLLFRLAR